jgi:hypothetical protein
MNKWMITHPRQKKSRPWKKAGHVYKYNCPISDYFGFLVLCKKIHR